MSETNLLSIVILVNQSGENLLRCLDGSMNQNYRNFEIIIIDCGEKKLKPALHQELTKLKTTGLIYRHQTDISKARTLGLQIAKGQFVTFINEGDQLDLKNYRQVVWLMNITNSEIGISNHQVAKRVKGLIIRPIDSTQFTIFEKNNIVKALLLGEKIDFHFSNKVFRRQLLAETDFHRNDMRTILNIFSRSRRIVWTQRPNNLYQKRQSVPQCNQGKYVELLNEANNFIKTEYPSLDAERAYFYFQRIKELDSQILMQSNDLELPRSLILNRNIDWWDRILVVIMRLKFYYLRKIIQKISF